MKGAAVTLVITLDMTQLSKDVTGPLEDQANCVIDLSKDGTYPPGLVVAQVTSVEKNAAFVFARIAAKPAAGVDNNRFVMVLPTPPAAPPAPEAKGEERKRGAAKGGRRNESR